MKRLNILSLENFIFESGEIALALEKRGKKTRNGDAFLEDLDKGNFDRYQRGREEYVLYKTGILCGHSVHKEPLCFYAPFYLCTPNLTVFRVPEKNRVVSLLSMGELKEFIVLEYNEK